MIFSTWELRGLLLVVMAMGLSPSNECRASIEITQDLDLDSLTISSNNNGNIIQFTNFAATPTAIAEGDEVTVTYNFLNGKKLRFNDLTSLEGYRELIWLFLRTADNDYSNFTLSDITVELLDPVASPGVPTTYSYDSQSSGRVHLGPNAYINVDPGEFVEFAGVTTTFTVTDLAIGSGEYIPWLQIQAESIEVVSPVAAVPEATSILAWTMALGGIGLIAYQRNMFSGTPAV